MTEIAKTVRKPMREPNWIPSGNKIMLQLDKVESFTAGGIFILPAQSERDSMNQTIGTVVALGPLAYKDMRGWDEESQTWKQLSWVEIGSRVKFQRHHGWVHIEGKGDDKVEYRVLHDTDLTMILRGEEEGEEK